MSKHDASQLFVVDDDFFFITTIPRYKFAECSIKFIVFLKKNKQSKKKYSNSVEISLNNLNNFYTQILKRILFDWHEMFEFVISIIVHVDL